LESSSYRVFCFRITTFEPRVPAKGARSLAQSFCQLSNLPILMLGGNPCAQIPDVVAYFRKPWAEAGKSEIGSML